MKTRFNMGSVAPEAYEVLGALDKYLRTIELDDLQKEMIKIRASQINGCAYCVNMHTKDALKYGETQQRLNLIAVWWEAGKIFTEEEQLLLKMTEEITLIHKKGLTDNTYTNALQKFGEKKTAQNLMAIGTINFYNRIGVALNMTPR